MSENLHTTAAPPEVAIYAEHVAEFIGPRTAPAAQPGEPILDFSLRAAILTACDRLEAATEEYAAASANLAEATVNLHDRRTLLQYAEDMETLRLIQAVPGKNAEERKAHLAVGLWEAEEVDEGRSALVTALARHAMAESAFRAADTAQKALRARLYALTALLGRS